MTRLWFLQITLLLALVPASAAGADQPLTVSVGFFTADAWTRDPFLATNYDHYLIFKHVGQTLVELGDLGDVIPGAASHWQISLDRKEYVFTLREGLKFHDGTPVTAGDVAATLNGALYVDKGPTIVYLQDIEGYEEGRAAKSARGIEVLSDRVLKVKLRQPYAPLLRVLTGGSLIIRPKADTKKPPAHLVASGPYRLELGAGRPVLVPFGEYKGPFPPKSARLEILADSDVFLGLKTPKELPTYDHDVTADRVHLYKERGYQLVENLRLTTSTFYVEPRSKRLPTYEARVALLRALTQGSRELAPKRLGKPVTDLYPLGMLGYRADRLSYKKLIDDIAKTKLSGPKTTIRLGLPGSFLWDKDAFKANVKKATGRDVEFVSVDFLTYAANRDRFDLDAIFVNWANIFPDPETNISVLRILDLTQNLVAGAKDVPTQTLLANAVTSAIDGDRAQVYGLIADRLFIHALALPVFQALRLEALDPRFKIKGTSYRQTPLLMNIELKEGATP